MGHRTTKTNHKVKVYKTVSCRIDFFYYAFRNVLLVSVPLLTFSIFVLTIPHSSAEISSGTDNVQLVLSTSCTVNAVVTSEHTVSLNGGQLDNNVGNTKLSAFCNDNNGYSIYAVGSSGDTDGNTDSINTVNESYNIHTGVYDDTVGTNPSSWAMKLTAGTGTGIDPTTGGSVPTTPPTIINGFDNYSTIPNVYTQVAKRTSGTSMTSDTSISGSYLNTTYQIYANSAQPAGTYNGKVKYVIVHPNSNHNTIPDLDTAFAVAGKMKVYEEGDNSYYAMQDMDAGICSMVTNDGESTSTQLVDTRDNNLYWVAKLKDGHCWMTQNLDLDLDPTKPLTSNDTDLTDHSLTGAYTDGYNYNANTGITTWTPERKTINFQNTTMTGWDNDNNNPYSANKTDSTKTGHASLGNYYNWTAAIASDNSSSLIQNTKSDITNNPKNSICPKGWRLPTISNQSEAVSSSTNEFARLNYLYNNNLLDTGIALTETPLYFIEPSYIYNNSIIEDSSGYYYSSTINDGSTAYNLSLSPNKVSSENRYGGAYGYRSAGKSVRCVAR